MLGKLLDTLFPRHCLNCGASGQYFCPRCRPHLRPAGPLDQPAVLAVFDYDDLPIRQAVWKLKYSGLTSLADEMSDLLTEHLQEELSDLTSYVGGKKIIVTAIPLSPKRNRKRGYNQSALLAKGLARRLPSLLTYQDILTKTKDTPPQVSLKNRAARLANLRGAFTVPKPELVAGRSIIIIDDVVTTGSTLAEAIKVLSQNNAQEVLGVAFSHRE